MEVCSIILLIKISKLLVLLFTTFCLIATVQVFAASEDKWGGYVEFFAKPGTERSLAKGDMFIPLQQNENFLLFANIRAVFDDHSSREGNFGFGARRLFDDWIFGGYGYFDIKESENDNTFRQATLGVELLSNDWDFRLNGYIPESDEEDADQLNRIEITGTQIGARLGEERALPGADIEVGRKLPFLEDTRFFLRGFYYDAVDLRNTALSSGNNSIKGAINNGLACRNRGLNAGSVGFNVGPIPSCP